MSINHINNLENGIDVRGTLNDTIDQVNTNTSDIAILQTDINNLDSGKQDADALSTIRDNYTADGSASSYTLLNTDRNNIILITPATSFTFVLPPTGTITNFKVGDKFIVVNDANSGHNATLTDGGGVTIKPSGNLVIIPGASAYVIVTSVNNYLRLF